MSTALEILRTYRALHTAPAFLFGGRWQAASQYGYSLADCASRKDAVRYAVHYYATRMHLIRQ